jgi:hypothetical protein
MAHVKAIYVCFDQCDDRWELPLAVSAGIFRCLVGWRVIPPAVDAGLSAGARKLLASALVSNSRVTFPCGSGRQFTFVDALRPEDAQRAFDAEYFDWTQRAQVIFLSPLETPPPVLSKADIRLAQRVDRQRLIGSRITGVVLPGVDGDVMGIYTFSHVLRDQLLAFLRTACAKAEVEFRVVTEAELVEALASGG